MRKLLIKLLKITIQVMFDEHLVKVYNHKELIFIGQIQSARLERSLKGGDIDVTFTVKELQP